MGDRSSILAELDRAKARMERRDEDAPGDARSTKKNFSEFLSQEIATKVANALRPLCPGVTPDEHGKEQESPALGVKGPKKLDVNFSTTRHGLGLGISIKTINARDPSTKRYTKNYSRNDNELRAEAMDYHKRQPYSVLVAVIFLPVDSCDDGKPKAPKKTKSKKAAAKQPHDPAPSSFGAAVRSFRSRAHRRDVKNDADLFERIYIGLYAPDDASEGDGLWDRRGNVWFFDVMAAPPKYGRPSPASLLSFDDMIVAAYREFVTRNEQEFEWAED